MLVQMIFWFNDELLGEVLQHEDVCLRAKARTHDQTQSLRSVSEKLLLSKALVSVLGVFPKKRKMIATP